MKRIILAFWACFLTGLSPSFAQPVPVGAATSGIQIEELSLSIRHFDGDLTFPFRTRQIEGQVALRLAPAFGVQLDVAHGENQFGWATSGANLHAWVQVMDGLRFGGFVGQATNDGFRHDLYGIEALWSRGPVTIEAFLGERYITARGGIVLGDRDSPIAGIAGRFAVNDRLTLMVGYDQLRYKGFLAQTHSEWHLGAAYAITDHLEISGKLRQNSSSAGGPDRTLFALGLTFYPTARKGGFSLRSFTPGGMLDY